LVLAVDFESKTLLKYTALKPGNQQRLATNHSEWMLGMQHIPQYLEYYKRLWNISPVVVAATAPCPKSMKNEFSSCENRVRTRHVALSRLDSVPLPLWYGLRVIFYLMPETQAPEVLLRVACA